MHQAAALPQGSPQECNPAQGTAAGAAQARRAGLTPEGTHTVHIHAHPHIHEYRHTHIPRVQKVEEHATLNLCSLLFIMSALGFLQHKQRQRIYGKRKI